MIEDKNRYIIIQKGTESDGDSYSAFYDNYKFSKKTSLDDELKARNINDLYICGLATDVCVAATARDSLKLFYKVNLVEDACRGVDRASIAATMKELIRAGAKIINSKELLDTKK
jgi:nicotinamidase/pyrazinamidase